MINGKKIIGVCMTKIHDTPRSRTIAYFHEQAEKRGMKLMIFNSSFDFYYDQEDDAGASKIYDYINYDIVDVLVILCSGFINKEIFRKIIRNAHAHNVPVILEDDYYEKCYTVDNVYEESLKKLMNHVINDHGIRDTFFIAGIKGNEYSNGRLEVYKDVLEENGIPYDDSMVDYGDFWEVPTAKIMDRMFESGRPIPGAIFCANDSMAVEVCKKLAEHGLRVPEDVIVTGFDGSKFAEFCKPRLSGCIANHEGFVDRCFEVINDIFSDGYAEKIRYNPYSLKLSESCGCGADDFNDFRDKAESSYRMVLDVVGHEHVLFNEIILRINTGELDINSLYGTISKIINNNSCLAMRTSFILAITGQIDVNDAEETDDKLMVVAASGSDAAIDIKKESAARGEKRVIFDFNDMIPAKEMWAMSSMMCVINEVNVGNISCGYYISFTENIINDAHIINRVLNMTDMLLHIAVADMRSRFLKVNRNKVALINTITELPNLLSATRWFNEYVERPEHSKKSVSVSVYELPTYNYLLDNYGIEEVETSVCFVAEALKVANTQNSYIAHTSDDQFIVICQFDDEAEVKVEVSNSAMLFFKLLEDYNKVNNKIYNLEVLAGTAHVTNIAEAKLDVLMRKASAKLLENMNDYHKLPVVKASMSTSKQQYKRFSVLLENNLFKYHFQPIVSASTGEIYGYEALMRTDESIGFNPLEVLSIAREYNHLYDIEKATMFNVMSRYDAEREKFAGKKVFINCIPGHFLNEKDNSLFGDKYSDYIDDCVFEITEQATITSQELDAIRRIGNNGASNSIAVDDYGIGHSNIINIMNYKPEIVKIDRFLMTDIHKDESKQMVVKGVIDFARLNNIKVLAEGIETEEELRKVIEMGVDYIQGYYTGRPAYEPIEKIDDRIKAVLLDAAKKNFKKSSMKNSMA